MEQTGEFVIRKGQQIFEGTVTPFKPLHIALDGGAVNTGETMNLTDRLGFLEKHEASSNL